MNELLDEAEAAFAESHDRAYWSDSNPRPPQGHDREFAECRDEECAKRRRLLDEARKPVDQ